MSENVDLVRSIFADWERGEFGSAAWASYDVEFTIAEGPARGTSTGKAAMAEAWRDFLHRWVDFRAAADDYRELDDQRVLVLSSLTGRGRSGTLDVGEMRAQGAHLFQIEHGEVVRLVVYGDRERALSDL